MKCSTATRCLETNSGEIELLDIRIISNYQWFPPRILFEVEKVDQNKIF